jgi:uncharacterized phiE125 gp8 family phage protein
VIVDLATIKEHLRIPHNAEDALLDLYRRSAVEFLARRQRQYWGPAEDVTLTASGADLWLVGPVISVASVTDGDGVVLDAADYTVSDYTVSIARYIRGTLHTVAYRHGFETDADVPDHYRQAVLLVLGHWYANRTPVAVATTAVELPFGLDELVPRAPVIG